MASLESKYSIAKPFAGKRVIVTGASSGIGLATAIAFYERGARVVVIARSKDKLDAIVAKDLGGNGLALQADFMKRDEILSSVKNALEWLGGLDVLVNNVGGSLANWASKPVDEQLQLQLQLNVCSAETATAACLPSLLESKGNVVNMRSIVATAPVPTFGYYCVAKAALHSLTKVHAAKYAEKGVRFNVVAAGPVDTGFFEVVEKSSGGAVKAVDLVTWLQAGVPLKRLGTSAEVAATICYLADNSAAGFVTGVELNIDGGIGISNWLNKPSS